MKQFFFRYRYLLQAIAFMLSVLYYFSLPESLFSDPYSTVLTDRNHRLLTASIASDGQWRFPQSVNVPDKFSKALIAFEDKRFWSHPGVDLISIGRAIRQNLQSQKIVSGGSTIDMQVIRLSRKKNSRTWVEKITEILLATRLQWQYSKEEILGLYASHAPFGGNVVGLEAACWRYFGRDPSALSWAEACMLAVLPNAPSLMHPGKNQQALLKKRNRLLKKLKDNEVIDSFTYDLALAEPIPDEPVAIPGHARHLLTHALKDGRSQQKIITTVQLPLQQRVEQLAEDHHQRLAGNQVHNACVLVIEVSTGNVVAYVGNVQTEAENGRDIDIISSPRSTGSILKPFLYAGMLDDGKLLPQSLLPDIPTVINGFAPKNFSRQYDGVVPADKALIRSLNVPAVHMLREYRYERFYELLKSMGMTTLQRSPDHYGLSLILGGAEGTVWDITGMYASMARTLNNYFSHPGKNKYDRSDFHAPNYVSTQSSMAQQPTSHNAQPVPNLELTSHLSASSIYLTFDVLKEVYRPGEETGWRYFSSSKNIAWKTGTSFGFRDGWAVGVTSTYAVGVWVGNADGEGRPGLTGTESAAPLLFDVFAMLPQTDWFKKPYQEMKQVIVCNESGYLLSPFCQQRDTEWVTSTANEPLPCTYHKLVHLSRDKKNRVHSACEPVDQIETVNWFVLSPVQEYFYRSKNVSYKTLPPFRADCINEAGVSSMDLIYPKPNARIFIPRGFDGTPGATVFELAHRQAASKVFWHLDGVFIGETRKVHQMAVNPGYGKHTLVLVDEAGDMLERHFEVLSKM